ncbi:MAG: hypothetical protein H6668_12595 [Ardenticatenaceae bacterium]|nr:hypothetical protein [Ardenticatenaceae bacterium]
MLAQNQTVFDVNEAMTALTLDIVARALFGFGCAAKRHLFMKQHQVNEYFGSLDPVLPSPPGCPCPASAAFTATWP